MSNNELATLLAALPDIHVRLDGTWVYTTNLLNGQLRIGRDVTVDVRSLLLLVDLLQKELEPYRVMEERNHEDDIDNLFRMIELLAKQNKHMRNDDIAMEQHKHLRELVIERRIERREDEYGFYYAPTIQPHVPAANGAGS